MIINIPLSELHPFPNHPFKVRDDDIMQETTESIKTYGVLLPAIARPREDGGYEIISGHRRKHACELAGLDTMPVIVRAMDVDAATILMVDSNIQRENVLPSERAAAYKMKLEAIKRQAGRPPKVAENSSENNSPQLAANFRSDDEVAKDAGVSGDTVRRYIRLTELSPELQTMVDEKKIAMTPAVEISYLKPEEQTMLLTAIDSEQATPSLSQAQRMKKLSQEGKLNDDSKGEGVPMNNTATATAKENVRRPAPAAPSSAGRMTRRVGNTTYRVTLHFKENGKEDMNDKIKRLIKMGCEG
ncbi:ParB/RepB/Spo0J family partition protein [Anaerotruncus rubiinfantis]|uniref:ParB/RepB/Spo0J family partition protein n=1 Tax=Anaerotruncus rubiinfantis TaxID=1720200 RepID=UPI003C2D7BF7